MRGAPCHLLAHSLSQQPKICQVNNVAVLLKSAMELAGCVSAVKASNDRVRGAPCRLMGISYPKIKNTSSELHCSIVMLCNDAV